MKVDAKAVAYILRQTVDRHRLDLASIDGLEVLRDSGKPLLKFGVRSRPWVYETGIVDRDLLLAGDARATMNLVEDKLAQAAMSLRGAIFRDLVLNDRDYPVDYIGDGDHDVLQARVEQLAIRLMTLVERIGK